MSRKINNHNINKDELLKRLKSGDSEGLDDFEKEAFEGFVSLENNELAEKLTASLEKRIEEKYNSEKKEVKVVAFTQKEETSKFRYYAMAAGLILVIGLTVLFFNQFTNKETNLAYKPQDGITTQGSDAVTKSLQNEIAKESGDAVVAKNTEVVASESKLDKSAQTSPPPPAPEKVTGGLIAADSKESKPSDDEDSKTNLPTPRMIAKEPVTRSNGALAEEQKAQQPDASAVATGKDLVFENAAGGKAEKDKEFKKGEALAKESDQRGDNYKSPEVASSKKQDVSKNKARRSNDNQSPGNLAQAAPASGNSQTVSSPVAVTGPKREEKNLDEMETTKHDENKAAPKTVNTSNTYGAGISGEGGVSLRRSTFFKTAKFANHLEYLKSEVNKNEALKTNLASYNKSFRIDLIISEKGKVTDAKADVPASCTDCKTQLENILKAMPNWEPAQTENGTPVKQTFYFSYKY